MNHAMVIRVLNMRTNKSRSRFNVMYITAFEIQRPWKIEGERFSAVPLDDRLYFGDSFDAIPWEEI